MGERPERVPGTGGRVSPHDCAFSAIVWQNGTLETPESPGALSRPERPESIERPGAGVPHLAAAPFTL
ncbi:hypothetical protein GCM10009678_09130 [Actinomadura kijaniata]